LSFKSRALAFWLLFHVGGNECVLDGIGHGLRKRWEKSDVKAKEKERMEN
jgi:hypothetical protein